MKLYKAYSRTQSADKKDKKKFQWFVNNRSRPVIPFEEAIWDYTKFTDTQKNTAEGLLNELFTEYEICSLNEYLISNCKTPVEAEEQILPLFINTELPLISFFNNFKQSYESGFYPLFEQSKYNLNFDVWGFYSTEIDNDYLPLDFEKLKFAIHQSKESKPILDTVSTYANQEKPENQTPELNYSKEFLSKALSLLGIGSGIQAGELQVICDYLTTQGYSVQKQKSKTNQVTGSAF
jgi:hypothetical protein